MVRLGRGQARLQRVQHGRQRRWLLRTHRLHCVDVAHAHRSAVIFLHASVWPLKSSISSRSIGAAPSMSQPCVCVRVRPFRMPVLAVVLMTVPHWVSILLGNVITTAPPTRYRWRRRIRPWTRVSPVQCLQADSTDATCPVGCATRFMKKPSSLARRHTHTHTPPLHSASTRCYEHRPPLRASRRAAHRLARGLHRRPSAAPTPPPRWQAQEAQARQANNGARTG